MEIDIPMHTATERFVLGVTAATQAVVFQRRPAVARFILAARIFERNAARDPVRSVPRNLDRLRASLVDAIAILDPAQRIAQRSRGAGPYGADDVVHPCSTGSSKWLLTNVERGVEPIGAETGV